MTTPYAPYADWALREYITKLIKVCDNDVDEVNWRCAANTMASFTHDEVKLLHEVYESPCRMFEAINNASIHTGAPVGRLWSLIKHARREFARQRGLIP